MNKLEFPNQEALKIEIKNLGDFDENYFKKLEGDDAWLALGNDSYTDQKYFTVYDTNNEKLGIIGVFNTAEDKHVIHTVVDPKYRGQGLASKFKEKLIDGLSLPFITLTIDSNNTASIRATEKLLGVKKVSDEKYEKEFGKVKYIYEPKSRN